MSANRRRRWVAVVCVVGFVSAAAGFWLWAKDAESRSWVSPLGAKANREDFLEGYRLDRNVRGKASPLEIGVKRTAGEFHVNQSTRPDFIGFSTVFVRVDDAGWAEIPNGCRLRFYGFAPHFWAQGEDAATPQWYDGASGAPIDLSARLVQDSGPSIATLCVGSAIEVDSPEKIAPWTYPSGVIFYAPESNSSVAAGFMNATRSQVTDVSDDHLGNLVFAQSNGYLWLEEPKRF